MASHISLFKYRSEWEYETSEDFSVSLFATVSFGTLVLKNPVRRGQMRIKYRCVSIGLSKGLPIGVSESQFTDDSSGYGTVVCDDYFSEMTFPCRGWIMSAGGTFGVFQEGQGTNGAAANIYFFGFWPTAAVRAIGSYSATTPGAGVGLGAASFKLAD
jgi:hypothetical protein